MQYQAEYTLSTPQLDGKLLNESTGVWEEQFEPAKEQRVSIQYDDARDVWEVALWNADDSNVWYKEFKDATDARIEYEGPRYAKGLTLG